MKMAMTALAVVFLAGGAPALARAQDNPDRPGAVDHDRPHRDGERSMGQAPRPPEARSPEARPPEARQAPTPPPPAAAPAAAEQHGGGRWSPGAGGYPGRGGVWTPNRGAPPAAQPAAPPPAQTRTPDRHDGDRFNGGDRFGGGARPDWRGGDGQDRSHDGDRDRNRGGDRGRDGDRDRAHDGDRHDGDRRDGDRYRDGDRRDGDRRDWGRYEGDSRNWGRYDFDRRWAGHEDRPRWERGRYPQVYVSPHRYRGYAWRPPSGYYLRTWGFGDFLPRGWYGPDWFLDDPWAFDLPIPPPGFDWVRVGYDAIMVDDYTGRVVQVVRNVFW
ncbi:MAG: RcnB family protein [Caulobacterales bacterium]|nr:RcnB family protein [Caulobacterales bacterium]